jgi:hypothetical protein
MLLMHGGECARVRVCAHVCKCVLVSVVSQESSALINMEEAQEHMVSDCMVPFLFGTMQSSIIYIYVYLHFSQVVWCMRVLVSMGIRK